MILCRARPLKTYFINSFPGNTCVTGRYRSYLLKYLLSTVEIEPFLPHSLRNSTGDPPVGPGLSWQVDGFSHPLHPSFGIGEGPILLSKSGGWEYHIGILAVSVRNISCTTKKSSLSRAFFRWLASASLRIGFSPTWYSALISPFRIWSNISVWVIPVLGSRSAPGLLELYLASV